MTEMRDVFARGLDRARRELAECEGFAAFYSNRAAKLRAEIRNAEEMLAAIAATGKGDHKEGV